ncbi:MAG: MBOAT family O-acyltransferase [Thermodesulfovibrionia bacterium]|nr:MBOAT family O-acyltransferase [Thermodesulfovibrionia bacterium]
MKIIIPSFGIPSFYNIHNITLPIGISFYTFQAISYCLDIYNKKYIPEKQFSKFALYISFFPKLLAGPIERADNLLPQFNNLPTINLNAVLNGVKRILWGLFKKIVIADKLALIVDLVYGNPYGNNGFTFLLTTYIFAFQIYCDFSGYCDIAIGTAQLFGYRLSENFQKPYLATSIADFWKRWHITLMSWFKDYIYIPLGGNTVSTYRWYRNIMIVFLVSGLWHGASLNFVIWGAIHGLFYVSGVMTANVREYIAEKIGLNKYDKLHKLIKTIVTFNLVSLGWIFFRANNLTSATYIIKTIMSDMFSLADLIPNDTYNLWSIFKIQGISQLELITYLLLLIFFFLNETFDWIERYYYKADINHVTIKELCLLNIIICSLLFLGDIGGKSFIYFIF